MKLSRHFIVIYCVVFGAHAFAQSSDNEINDYDSKGKTQLINAVSKKDLDGVKSLLQQGADPNIAEKDGLGERH